MSRQGGFNGTRQIIDIAATGAALTPILATGPVRYVLVRESQKTAAGAANVPVGFEYTLPNDGFIQALETIPGDTMEIGDPMALHDASHGSILGNGPNPNIGIGTSAATTLFKAGSIAAATSIEVTQYY